MTTGFNECAHPFQAAQQDTLLHTPRTQSSKAGHALRRLVGSVSVQGADNGSYIKISTKILKHFDKSLLHFVFKVNRK